MKHRDILTDLRQKNPTDLVNLLKQEEGKLIQHRFDAAFRKLKQTSDLRTSRRSIARIQTILREKLTGAIDDKSSVKEQ